MGDSMKNPIKILFQEHEVILTAIEVAKQADKIHDKSEAAYLSVVRYLINFFRSYVDKYHH